MLPMRYESSRYSSLEVCRRVDYPQSRRLSPPRTEREGLRKLITNSNEEEIR